MEVKTIYKDENYELMQTKWHYHLSANPNGADWEVATFFDKIRYSGIGEEYYLVLDGCDEDVGMMATSSMPKELCEAIEKLPMEESSFKKKNNS